MSIEYWDYGKTFQLSESKYSDREWTRRSGEKIRWKDMTIPHLEACVAKLRREADATQRVLDSWDFALSASDEISQRIASLRLQASEIEIYLKGRRTAKKIAELATQQFSPSVMQAAPSTDWTARYRVWARWGEHPSRLGSRIWPSQKGELLWSEMKSSHLMNCVRLLERKNPDNPAVRRGACDMWRYVAWREKAHA